MYSSTIMASQASMSFEMPASYAGAANGSTNTASTHNSGALPGVNTSGGGAGGASFSMTQQTSSVSIAFEAADALMSGLGDSMKANDMLKMIVAMLVLSVLLGNEDQQSQAMGALGELLGQSSEQLSLSISSTTTSLSMSGGSTMPAESSGQLLDVMA